MTVVAVAERADSAAFVIAVNKQTFCVHCGKQPVDWHNPDHIQNPTARVSVLRARGASVERIRYEMSVSVPLCRSCHMIEDGRATALQAAKPRQRGDVLPAGNCSCCGREYKPLRQGRCSGCYNHATGLRARKVPNGCGCDQ